MSKLLEEKLALTLAKMEKFYFQENQEEEKTVFAELLQFGSYFGMKEIRFRLKVIE